MIKKLFQIFLIVFILNFLSSCEDKPVNNNPTKIFVPKIRYKYIKSYPHNTTSFTEGLFIHNDKLYESTGSPEGLTSAKSLIGIVDLTTGEMTEKIVLDRTKFFGEGIAIFDGKIFQLTYKKRIGFVYDAETFKKIREFTIPSEEGWGLTSDDTNLIMSDGTYMLTYLDPTTLEVTKTINVTENGNAKDFLNELEYINGYIYANVWTTNTIVKINPANGKVVGIIDLKDLALEANNLYPYSLEMNGIAYDSSKNKIYVTGKMWPRLYEIQLYN